MTDSEDSSDDEHIWNNKGACYFHCGTCKLLVKDIDSALKLKLKETAKLWTYHLKLQVKVEKSNNVKEAIK